MDSSSILYIDASTRGFGTQSFCTSCKFSSLYSELERIVNSFHLISLSYYVALLNQGCAWRTNVRWKSECSRILAVNFHDNFKDEIPNNFSLYIYRYKSLIKYYNWINIVYWINWFALYDFANNIMFPWCVNFS